MKVCDLMTREPFTLLPDASLDDAMTLMDRLQVRHVPVAVENVLIGLVSERDLLEETGWVPAEEGDAVGKTVSDVMTRRIETADPETEVVTLAVELITGAFGCLPVVSDGRLVGIVTENDILEALSMAYQAGSTASLADPTVASLMTSNVVTLPPGASQEEAIELCRQHHIRHLPIVEGKRFVGLVSDRDLRRAHGRHQDLEPILLVAMRSSPVTLPPSAPISVAVEAMLERKVSSLPIVDEAGELVGIVTSTDLMDHGMNTLWAIE